LGEFERARATQSRALAIVETVYGVDHTYTRRVREVLENLGGE
jgi:hypothetical protein